MYPRFATENVPECVFVSIYKIIASMINCSAIANKLNNIILMTIKNSCTPGFASITISSSQMEIHVISIPLLCNTVIKQWISGSVSFSGIYSKGLYISRLPSDITGAKSLEIYKLQVQGSQRFHFKEREHAHTTGKIFMKSKVVKY